MSLSYEDLLAQKIDKLRGKRSWLRVLVTGGSGFIGSNLAKALCLLPHVEVWSTSSGAGQKPHGLVVHRGVSGINFKELPKFDAVFHQAALNDTREQDGDAMDWVNIRSTLNLLNACFPTRDPTPAAFIVASSSAVYGNLPGVVTEVGKVDPLTPYACSKFVMEERVLEWFRPFQQYQWTALRYCNVYGPGESHKGKRASMIHQMITANIQDRPVKLFRDGSQIRTWIHVDDVVEANIRAWLTRDVPRQGLILNVASGWSLSFAELAEEIMGDSITDLVGQGRIVWADCPFPDEFQRELVLDRHAAKQTIGFEASRPLSKGLLQMEDHIRAELKGQA